MGPRRHWVVLGSFIPCLYSGILTSLLFGLNDFAKNKTNFGFSQVLSRRAPHFRWSPAALEDSEVTLRCSLESLCHRICDFHPPSTPMDKYLHLSCLLLFPIDLVITRYPEILSIVPRIFCAYCLAVLCHLNSPTDNSRTYWVSAHPQLIQVFHKSVQNTIRSSENPQEPVALEILAY